MHFNCTFCGGKIEGEEAWIGLDSVCPYCKMEITVPEPLVRDTTPAPLPTEEDAVSIADVDAETAAKTTEGAATTSSDVTFGGGASSENSIDLNGKWIVGGSVGLLLLFIVCLAAERGQKSVNATPSVQPTAQEAAKNASRQALSDAYDKGSSFAYGFSTSSFPPDRVPSNAELDNFATSQWYNYKRENQPDVSKLKEAMGNKYDDEDAIKREWKSGFKSSLIRNIQPEFERHRREQAPAF